MQRHVVKSLEDLKKVISTDSQEPEHITIPNAGGGVWLSNSLWDYIQARDKESNASSASLEKAVSLLIQESEKAEQSSQAVAKREEQFVRIFALSLTPMRIEDWTEVRRYLAYLGKRYNLIEIKEHLQSNSEEIAKLLKMVKVTDCNRAFREALDAEHNPDYLGSLDKIIPMECYSEIIELLLQVSDGKADIRQSIKLRRFDGGMRDVQMHMSLYSDTDKTETKMLVSYWDVTQQNRITKSLHSVEDTNEEERTRSLLALNSIREGVITTDQQGNVINLNPTAKQITGWEHDFFQRPLTDIFSPANEHYTSIGDVLDGCKEHFSPLNCDTVSEFCNRHDEKFWVTYSITPIVSDDLISGFIVIFHDVSESKQLLEQIKRHKNQDPITKLLNRQAFKARLGVAINKAEKQKTSHALLLVDIDQFHIVNDTFGHSGGDVLLKEVADIVKGSVRADDVVARIGGDEFGVLLSNCAIEAGIRIAQDILDQLEQHKFIYDSKTFKLGASIGIVAIDSLVDSVDKVLIDAGSVVQVAKESGSHRVQVFDPNQEVLLQKQDQLRWFSKITDALENDLMVLSYQKICPTCKKEADYDSHYEILIRMLDDDGSLIPPGEFIPAAERYNLMPQIDRWVVKTALQWIELNLHRSNNVSLFSINLSGQSIGEDAFLNYVDNCFKKFHVPGSRICFEITETMAINNLENTLNFIERFKEIGCKFSLDDFGTGFSSYGYLKTLPVDFLKIDGSFVRRITEDPIDFAMVKSINEVGHVMNRKTIAEYVENKETMELLRQIGVDYAQGYGIEKPQPLGGFFEERKIS